MPAKDIAVVLSGGGAYAAYEVGAMRAILHGETVATGKQPIDPGIYCGTSAGALNAAVMVETGSVDHLERIWREDFAGATGTSSNGVLRIRLNPFSYGDLSSFRLDPVRPFSEFAGDAISIAESLIRRGASFVNSPKGTAATTAFELVDVAALVCTDPLAETLRRTVNLERIHGSARRLQIVATNWTTGEIRVFGNEHFSTDLGYAAIHASTAIPGIFPPVTIDGSIYVDGGLVANSPLKPAIGNGASEIHIVYIDPNVSHIPISRMQGTLEALDRSLAIALANIANRDIDNAHSINQGIAARRTHKVHNPEIIIKTESRLDQHESNRYRELTIHRYHPKEDLGGGLGVLNFSRDAIERLIDKGYEDTLRHDCVRSGCVLPA